MDKIILYGLLVLGLLLLLFIIILRRPSLTHTLLIFFMTAYFTTFIGVFVVEMKLLEYPVKFLSGYFDTSILYEYLLFPVVCIYFYKTTYHSKVGGILIQASCYTIILTAMEVLFEKYTSLVEYHSWTWVYTLCSVFLLLLFIRGVMGVVRTFSKSPSN